MGDVLLHELFLDTIVRGDNFFSSCCLESRESIFRVVKLHSHSYPEVVAFIRTLVTTCHGGSLHAASPCSASTYVGQSPASSARRSIELRPPGLQGRRRRPRREHHRRGEAPQPPLPHRVAIRDSRTSKWDTDSRDWHFRGFFIFSSECRHYFL